MKIEVPKSKASRLVNPGEVILVSSAYKDKSNIITLAWHMPISKDPALLGIAVAKSHFSYELIKESEEFIINIPGFDILKEVIFCGSTTGRKADKFKESNLSAAKAERLIKTPVIKECLGHIECSLSDVKDIGDHGLFIGEVIYAAAEKDLFGEAWHIDKAKLIFHFGGALFTTNAEKIDIS
ncbi:MAG: flavin reductase family protein [Candidatus Omnitrophica bacterium]|nr:flavin reductase family protein [Candidatus Omnitrophota bacterium]